MSGHNRWSKIKHDKAGVDKKKNLERSQLARDIMQASKRMRISVHLCESFAELN